MLRNTAHPRTAAVLFSLILPWMPAGHALSQPDTDTAESDAAPAPAFSTAEVTEGGFVAEVTMQGRFAADPRGDVRYEPKAYTGELNVAEVLVDHGWVSSGQAVLRLEAPDLAEQLDDARDALVKAEQRLAWSQREAEMSETERAIAAERRKLTKTDLLADYKRWETVGKKDAYRHAELQMQRQEDRFADSAQELKQLEELYKNAKLASRTQDIVLERSRRDLAVSKTYLEIARRNYAVQKDVTLPRQQRDLDNQMRWMETDQRHARWRETIARERSAVALETAEESVKQAREKIADLEADRAGLLVKAESAGILTAIGVGVGDKVQANQALSNLLDQAKGTLTADIPAGDLRVVEEGASVGVRWSAFGEVQSKGTVRLIAWQGQAAGDSPARYTVKVDVKDVAPMIRPGMAAAMTVTRPMENSALSVPASAVATDEDGAYCMVQQGDGFVRRAVVAGASNAERIQIVSGLTPGQTVRVPAK